jgi:tetratricopeptide (TPR) repeat protein/GTP-binding protein EngB required for normal cell division
MGIFDRIAGTLEELTRETSGPAEAKEEVALALAFADRGDLETAQQRLQDLTLRFPRLALGFATLGEVHARRRDVEDAIAAYGRAVDLDPDDVDSWFRLGELLAERGRFEPARDALRRALTLSVGIPQRGRAHAALGQLYAAAGQLGKALRELQKAVDLLPDDHGVAAAFGRALARSGDAGGADWLTRAARAEGADPALFVEAAAAESDAAVGEALLREALGKTPEHVGVRAALSRHLTRSGRLADGLALALECLAVAPSDPAALRALREGYAGGGRWTEALEVARREAEIGAPPPLSDFVALALGAQDRTGLEQIATGLHGPDPAAESVLPALRAFLIGTAREPELLTLAALAPDQPSQRFVVRALAPPPPPRDNLFALLGYAHELASRSPELWSLTLGTARALESYDRPLLVAVMGEFNAGKSSFVNALCGEEVAPVGVTPTTATINILRHGPTGGRVVYHDGTARDLGPQSVGPFLRELSDGDAERIRVVEIFFPLDILRRVEIVDTPGLNSLRPEHEKVARDFLLDADAIVWVFAVGQAAKATERQALELAHAAGKRVLGVLNKVDRASAEEVAEVARHVGNELGDLVEIIVPFSARLALDARKQGGGELGTRSGLAAVDEALEERFFRHARDLKRTTALAALRRFVGEASAAATAGTSATTVGPADFAGQQRALASSEQRLRGAVAAERVALRARIDEAYRSAAFEVREFVRPRTWLFGEHRADPADEEFLVDLLDDAIGRATGVTRRALHAAAAPAEDGGALPAAIPVIDAAVERFRAYARGVIEGGAVAEFFRHDLPRIRLDLAAIRNALARRAPDPEPVLFRTLDADLGEVSRRARAELAAQEKAAHISALVREERIEGPLVALRQALDGLGAPTEGPAK